MEKLNLIFEDKTHSDREKKKQLLLMNVKIIQSQNLEGLFQYWKGLEKFDWKTLEFSYENMSFRSLVEIINYSSQEYGN